MSVDGFGYRVAFDGSGHATAVTKVSEPDRSGEEKLQIAVANVNHRKPEEMFPSLDRSKTEPLRQGRARQEAEAAWKGTPAKSGEYDENVDGFTYHVKVSSSGVAESVTLTHEPERSGKEQLQIAVAKANHRKPEEMFPALDRSKGEPGRQARAKQQAVTKYLSSPENQARIKREAELRQQQEALRKQQEQEARQEAEAQKRAGEALKKLESERHAAEDRLHSDHVMAVRGFPAEAAVSLAPLRYTVSGTGSVTLGEEIATAVRGVITTALTELDSLATASLVGPVGVAIASLFYSKELGKGSDKVPGGIESHIAGLMPADAIRLPDDNTLHSALASGKTVSMSVRGLLEVADGQVRTSLVHTAAPSAVRVAAATVDASTGYYGFTLPEEASVPTRTIWVSPAAAPGASGPTILTGPVPLPEVITHTGGPVQVMGGITTTEYPCPDDVDIRDLILVFPDGSGLKPVYVMLNSLRSKPGKVTGKGQDVSKGWLNNAGKDLGAPIPSKIADKLRGKEFKNFKEFREAIWSEVASVPELMKQFNATNKEFLKKGYSAFVPNREKWGGREKFEIHHVKPISENGAVYDIDNLRVVTPKRHVEIHSKNGGGLYDF